MRGWRGRLSRLIGLLIFVELDGVCMSRRLFLLYLNDYFWILVLVNK